MDQKCIIVSGPKIANDLVLLELLRPNATVLTSSKESIPASVIKKGVHLVLLEIGKKDPDLLLIMRLKKEHPNVTIIVVDGNGDRRAIVSVFKAGADDVFRKPYDPGLLAERVQILLKRK